MRLPLEIVARHVDLAPPDRQEIEKRAEKLDQFYDRIMRCRVTVEGPGRHHLQGFFTLRLDITVPGKKIVINRQSGENLVEAIREAFAAGERSIEDHIRLSRRQVKVHDRPPRARVRRLFPEKGYGFLETPDGREIYFHRNSVVGAGFARLKPGTLVRFAEEMGEKGPQASTVAILKRRASTARQAEPGMAAAPADRRLPEEPPPAEQAPRFAPREPTGRPVFGRILVPLDGSLTSEAILPYLRRYFAGSEVVLVRTPETVGIADEARRSISLTLERLRREGFKARAHAGRGLPAEAILQAARRTRSDLIALTTHGRTATTGLLMGSVAEFIVRTSSVPVFVVRPFRPQESGQTPSQRTGVPRRILVPLDGSDASLAILSHVLTLAKQWEGRVLLLHVSPGDVAAGRPAADEALARIQDELDAAAIPVEWLEARGDPLARILEVSRTRDVDLIAMATSAGPPERALDDRSLTGRVIRNARVPIFAVRADTEAPRPSAAPAIEDRGTQRAGRASPRRTRRAARRRISAGMNPGRSTSRKAGRTRQRRS